ncbi:putative beta-mannosidase [Clavispora lusitaniae]|uniref:Beta-mannosidase B n=1 Tax=Clavispora lusitaniae TaxID=36911 RepID=A0AA91PXS4_CLALS|nr:putative beta-mannosidase [Clavispora lusitaniae]
MVNHFSQLKGWRYRKLGEASWNQSAPKACTEIHADLLHNKEIPDPFLDMNEKEIQWVGETDWEYYTEFDAAKELEKSAHVQLEFQGLDTFATVYVNDVKILTTENMFVSHKVDVKDILHYGKNNIIKISFKSALKVARDLEKIHGAGVCWNGESCRLQIRKAQYTFGWDWGPIVMTCGPSKPILLHAFDNAIEDVFVDVCVDDELNADIDVHISLVTSQKVEAKISVVSPDGAIVKEQVKSGIGSGTHSVHVSIEKPKLWFPWTIGTPNLYTFKVEIVDSNGIEDRFEKKIGLRKVELVQESVEDEKGTSFYFKVNGTPVFSVGANWIPAHSIPTLLSEADYTQWLELAKMGNQNMIRVWAGGFYETDVFYDECDRLGIMVWQDFMFACGQYPAYDSFIENVKSEVHSQLLRLRNHACLTLFAGNNEDYQIAEQSCLEWDPHDHSGDYSKTSFPARKIYEIVLPKLMKDYLPSVPYHPGSPWSGDLPTFDPTVGDLHQWNVWHGSQEKYQDWYKLGGRFVSEFGMEGLPCMQTFKDCITDEKQIYPQSEYVDHHNKADGFERRLALYVIENIKMSSFDMESWIYATQLMQAECLAYAYRCWRRNWKHDGKRSTGGILVWQLNDCWPTTSWAIVDFFKRPKLAYYAVKRESQSISIGMYRNVHGKEDNEHAIGKPHDYKKHSYSLDIWGANAQLEDVSGHLSVSLYDVESGKKLSTLVDEKVTIKANGVSEFFSKLKLPQDGHVVVYARFVDSVGKITTTADWPQPLKYLSMPDRNVSVKVCEGYLLLSAEKPTKSVEILLNDRVLEDNGFDLFPGDDKKVHVEGLNSHEKVAIRYYQ